MDHWDRVEKLTSFAVTDEHLTLLRHAYVDWNYCESGAPAIDCKRPYGNSDVSRDMAELLHPEFGEMREGAASDWLDDNAARLSRLHAETGVALQIALCVGEFRTGHYRRKPYLSRSWRRADGEPAVSS